MKISNKGIDFIIREEGERLAAYKCAAGVWTIGVGHTGKDVYRGLKITKERSRELLMQDIAKFEKGVNDSIQFNLTQEQFNALVSFAFNVGVAAFKNSTLRKIINAKGKSEDIRYQFSRWNKANKKVLAGLTNRRKREADLFIFGKYN